MVKHNELELNDFLRDCDIADLDDTVKIKKDGIVIGEFTRVQELDQVDLKEFIETEALYNIPSYQRGYRWEKEQIEDFINDIWEWSEDEKDRDEKYCLQPIVISENEDGNRQTFDVIDGQQRITTLYIILKVLKSKGVDNINLKYNLQYKTRENSKEFLENIDDYHEGRYTAKDGTNIDYHYMSQAYKTAEKMFNGTAQDKSINPETWFNKLINEIYGAFFIRYNVSLAEKDAEHTKIFTRINAGKIPLTEAELIKALILKSSNFNQRIGDANQSLYVSQKQFEIATEWDYMQKHLNNENFWSWLGQDLNQTDRIGLILEMTRYKLNKDNKGESLHQFYQGYIKEKIEDGKAIEFVIDELWKNIKRVFMRLEDLYDDNFTYHLYGFLNNIHTRAAHNKIIETLYSKKKKSGTDFPIVFLAGVLNQSGEEKLKNAVYQVLLKEDDIASTLGGINYNDKDKVRDILLLLNLIQSVNANNRNTDNKIKDDSYAYRFPFNHYKTTKWDIEHIHPQNYEELSYNDLSGNIKSRVDELIEELIEKRYFDNKYKQPDNEKLYESLLNKNDENRIDKLDSIGNLTLLNQSTNRGIGNLPYALKRLSFIQNESEGEFAPIDTKNTFSKYYSNINEDAFVWGIKDIENRMAAIEGTFRNFFGEEEKDDEN